MRFVNTIISKIANYVFSFFKAKKNMKNISFLIGSGFSVPAGYPTTSEMNQRLGIINMSEICIHTNGDAWFLNGDVDQNADHMKVNERRFVQEFLKFYNRDILKGNEGFHYETFYDYYRKFIDGQEYTEDLNTFLTEFRETNGDDHNILYEFHLTFVQLIQQLLEKDLERGHLAKPYHPNYSTFLLLVESLSKTHQIHFHSLNHDLYLEHLSISDCMHGKLDDGFEELGSPYYGKLYKKYEKYFVRLPKFTNKYVSQFCLYKLHGSIDHYWYKNANALDLIKLKREISQIDLYKEEGTDDNLRYVNDPTNYIPDFLTGVNSKVGRYVEGKYYPCMMKYFENNLNNSNTLIVIGYGFGDVKINEFIDEFSSDDQKVMFIVGIDEPQTDLLQHTNVHFVDGGVSGMNKDFILNNMRM